MASTGAHEPLSPQRSLLESLPFYRFCQGLELAAVHSRAIDKLAQVFPDKLQESVETELAAGRPCSWYPLMRLLIPDADRTRHKYNIGLKNLQVMIVEKILLLPREAPAAQKVYNFTNPNVAGSLAARQRSNRGSGSTTSGAGDFAQVIENVLEPRRKGLGRTLTIGDVNAKLDALATATTGDERFVVMTDLYNNFSANEMKWTLRIILKNMMIGLKKAVVLKWYHPDAADYYDACNKLEQVLDSAFATPGLPHAPSLAFSRWLTLRTLGPATNALLPSHALSPPNTLLLTASLSTLSQNSFRARQPRQASCARAKALPNLHPDAREEG